MPCRISRHEEARELRQRKRLDAFQDFSKSIVKVVQVEQNLNLNMHPDIEVSIYDTRCPGVEFG